MVIQGCKSAEIIFGGLLNVILSFIQWWSIILNIIKPAQIDFCAITSRKKNL